MCATRGDGRVRDECETPSLGCLLATTRLGDVLQGALVRVDGGGVGLRVAPLADGHMLTRIPVTGRQHRHIPASFQLFGARYSLRAGG